MGVDFDRSSSSYIYQYTGAIPVGTPPMSFECWCQIDSWGGTGITYGNLIGVYSTSMAWGYYIRIKRVATGFPVGYYAEMVTARSVGTAAVSSANIGAANIGNWHHVLGYVDQYNNIGIVLNGTRTTGSGSAGLAFGLSRYTIGRDEGGGTPANYFDGRIAEAAVWACAFNTGWLVELGLTACKGLPPIHRNPFYAYGSTGLKSWLPLHNTGTNQDVMRPSVTYSENSVTSHEDHPPIIQPRLMMQRGGPPAVYVPPVTSVLSFERGVGCGVGTGVH
jgi:hypothetical protein